jgi:hypothetical protein
LKCSGSLALPIALQLINYIWTEFYGRRNCGALFCRAKASASHWTSNIGTQTSSGGRSIERMHTFYENRPSWSPHRRSHDLSLHAVLNDSVAEHIHSSQLWPRKLSKLILINTCEKASIGGIPTRFVDSNRLWPKRRQHSQDLVLSRARQRSLIDCPQSINALSWWKRTVMVCFVAG